MSDWRWTFQTDGRPVIDLHHSQVCLTKNPTINPPAVKQQPVSRENVHTRDQIEAPVGSSSRKLQLISISWWEVVYLNPFPGALSCVRKAGQFFITTVWEEPEFWASQRQLSRWNVETRSCSAAYWVYVGIPATIFSSLSTTAAQCAVRCSERQSCSGLDDWLQTRGQPKCC